ncbi:uncharacterized protein LOC109596485 [Aethina tumida]|uniref:uncharacterized protein LOC109596485 n=1 Tax=Aethina tumida TaxID=116153 RepID=UPI00096B1548|nr:uncharacterized protein LOC109596485 [Aethina tumida]
MSTFYISGLNPFLHVLKCSCRYSSIINISSKIIKEETSTWISRKTSNRKYCAKKPLSSLDRAILGILPTFMHPLWIHPAGVKTIFFWAPTAKWGLVIAGLSDLLARDPHVTSINQTAVLALTGLIWSRYSLVIIPKNWNLFLVNFFVFLVQSYSVTYAIKAQYLE